MNAPDAHGDILWGLCERFGDAVDLSLRAAVVNDECGICLRFGSIFLPQLVGRRLCGVGVACLLDDTPERLAQGRRKYFDDVEQGPDPPKRRPLHFGKQLGSLKPSFARQRGETAAP